MNDESTPPVLTGPFASAPKPPRRRFLWLRLPLYGLAALVVLAALFYVVENWRGRRAWESHRQELEKRGEKLDLAAFIPPSVPEEENFAATPYLAGLFVGRPNPSDLWPTDFNEAEKQFRKIHKSSRTADERVGLRERTDLESWEAAFERVQGGQMEEPKPRETADAAARARAAGAVLEALKVYDPVLDELRAASSRPQARYDVRYDLENPFGILLPHLSVTRRICAVLKLRAAAHLAAGQSDRAFQDLKLILRVADSIASEPFLISGLVRQACAQVSTDVLWEGLAEGRWSEAHLAELQSYFQSRDFLSGMYRALRTERAAGVATIDSIRRKPTLLRELAGDSDDGPATGLLTRLAPRGWFYFEQRNYSSLFQEAFLTESDAATKRVRPSRSKASDQKLQKLGSDPVAALFQHNVFARLLLPALSLSLSKAARAQTLAEQAALGCALERFRRARGQFPERLEALAPQFIAALPHDVISGEPLKYRRLTARDIEIYSIGWNETDDDGQSEARPEAGDWVWHQTSPK